MSAAPIVMGYHLVPGTNPATTPWPHSSHKPQPPTCGDFVAGRVWIRAKGPAGRQIRVNALEHLPHGPNLLGGEPLKGLNVCSADNAPDQPKNGPRVFRDCKRPHPTIAQAPATLRPSIGFQPVQDAYQTRRIDLADLRQARLADTLVFREENQRFTLC